VVCCAVLCVLCCGACISCGSDGNPALHYDGCYMHAVLGGSNIAALRWWVGSGRLWVLVNSISHKCVVCACQMLHAVGIRHICAVVCRAHQLLEMQHLVLGADDVLCQM